jgi:hypothetical protein
LPLRAAAVCLSLCLSLVRGHWLTAEGRKQIVEQLCDFAAHQGEVEVEALVFVVRLAVGLLLEDVEEGQSFDLQVDRRERRKCGRSRSSPDE